MDIKTAKTNIIKGKLERYGSNPQKCWQEINKPLPQSQNTTVLNLKKENSDTIVEGMDLNEHINEYFSSIGSELALKCTPSIGPGNVENVQDDNILFDRTLFTEAEVMKVCNDINIGKSAAIPNIKTFVLKHALLSCIPRCTTKFNTSLNTAIFLKSWKLSTIVPIPKIPHPNTANDLRPVALTPLPGKLMEKLICKKLQCWIANNNLLSNYQHGFRKKRSTVSAIATLLNNLD